MKLCNTYLLVAAMAVSSMAMPLMAADSADPMQQPSSMNTNTNMGGTPVDEATNKDARTLVANVVNDGVEENKFDSLTGYLSKTDRERMGKLSSNDNSALNNAIKQFRDDFKAKYNQDFDLQADKLTNVNAYAGQDKKSATLRVMSPEAEATSSAAMNNTNNINQSNDTSANGATADRTLNTAPTDQTVSNRNGVLSASDTTSATAGNRTGPASNGSNSNSTVHGNDVTATPGVAANTVNPNMQNMNNQVASNVGASPVTLNLVNDGMVMNDWHISTTGVSPDQLRQNLTKNIQAIDDMKAAWPADVDTAYRAVAYHVLQSFNETSMATER